MRNPLDYKITVDDCRHVLKQPVLISYLERGIGHIKKIVYIPKTNMYEVSLFKLNEGDTQSFTEVEKAVDYYNSIDLFSRTC